MSAQRNQSSLLLGEGKKEILWGLEYKKPQPRIQNSSTLFGHTYFCQPLGTWHTQYVISSRQEFSGKDGSNYLPLWSSSKSPKKHMLVVPAILFYTPISSVMTGLSWLLTWTLSSQLTETHWHMTRPSTEGQVNKSFRLPSPLDSLCRTMLTSRT